MTTWTSVGKSHYRGDVYGVEQFMERAAALQVLALIAFIATLPGCRRMTVNEGRRTRDRQRTLRQRYEAFLRGGPWAPLAAVLFTSRHDEVRHGNAADLGGPDGEALNAAEIAALKKYGPDFGVQFTGLTFSPPEPWHVEADGRTPIPQYALASLDAALFPESEEDELNQTEKDQLKFVFEVLAAPGPVNGGVPLAQQIIAARTDAGTAAAQAKAAAIDAYAARKLSESIFAAVFLGGDSMPDKVTPGGVQGRSLGQSLAEVRALAKGLADSLTVQSRDDIAKGRPSVVDQIRNVYDGLFKSGPSIPNGSVVSMLRQLLGFEPRKK